MASTPRTPRRGLPRAPGGEPWPPAGPGVPEQGEPRGGEAGEVDASGGVEAPGGAGAPHGAGATDSDLRNGIGSVGDSRPNPVHASESVEAVADPGSSTAVDAMARGVRRGLPREPGGVAWPPASGQVDGASAGVVGPVATEPEEASERESAAGPRREPERDAPAGESPAPVPRCPRPPLTVARTVWPGAAARRRTTRETPTAPARPTAAAGATGARPGAAAATGAKAGPGALGDYSPVQLLGATAVLGVFALALVGIAVLLARFVLALGPGRDFLAAFPGEYPLPDSAPVGLPAWLNWSHFLNSFFLLLIIRTGWQVRREKRPAAFWSPRNNKKRRISLALWFHQALDILWIANGVIFVVLLFVTGQWMRIVPTSWEVFPNALSAALQYASLDWPTENGWVAYNSLQQLSYFAITFVAAPLAIVSGVRLSGVWPKKAEKLSRLYPIEWARRVHFPVMLFFVAFIVVHVALVLATGALRNLNHMYAARGSVDPGEFTGDPTGLLIFAASLLLMAAAWVAARPAVLVPIARLFGEVKQR